MAVVSRDAGGGNARPPPAGAVLDQRPVPAAVERASDRPDIARGGRPDCVEVKAQRGRGVEGDGTPVSAVGLKAEGTVATAAPRGANNPRGPALAGDPVQRGAVQARGRGDSRPAPAVESKHQRLGRPASAAPST